MLSISWNNERMSVGVDIIDTQHKKLIDLINNIIFSIEKNTQIEDIDKIIEDTLEYAKYHFKTEENLFLEYNMDKNVIDEHKKVHQEFTDKATGLYSKIKDAQINKSDYGIEMLTDLYKYLASWLVMHILSEDKKIFNLERL